MGYIYLDEERLDLFSFVFNFCFILSVSGDTVGEQAEAVDTP